MISTGVKAGTGWYKTLLHSSSGAVAANPTTTTTRPIRSSRQRSLSSASYGRYSAKWGVSGTRRLDHRHDSGLGRLGQLGPGIDHSGQVQVIPVPGTDPAARRRNRRFFEGGRSNRRQPGRWNSSTSIYPLTTRAPSGGTRRVRARRAHRNGHSPGHDSQLSPPVYDSHLSDRKVR